MLFRSEMWNKTNDWNSPKNIRKRLQEEENKLLRAKVDAIKSAERQEELYAQALRAMS